MSSNSSPCGGRQLNQPRLTDTYFVKLFREFSKATYGPGRNPSAWYFQDSAKDVSWLGIFRTIDMTRRVSDIPQETWGCTLKIPVRRPERLIGQQRSRSSNGCGTVEELMNVRLCGKTGQCKSLIGHARTGSKRNYNSSFARAFRVAAANTA